LSVRFLIAVFEFVLLIFSLSVHECAHAWTASYFGDQTARLQGRVTLNPMYHIDPVGTLLFPALIIFGPFIGFTFFSGLLVGWAKPTPVDTRNFKNPVRDDILTTVAGPVSNLLTAFVSVIILAVIARHSASGIGPNPTHVDIASPLITLFYLAMWINVILAVFNMIPLPPLDGSHVLRHFLSYNALQVYDRIGNWGLIVVVFLLPMIGINIVGMLIMPFMAFFQALLALFLGIR